MFRIVNYYLVLPLISILLLPSNGVCAFIFVILSGIFGHDINAGCFLLHGCLGELDDVPEVAFYMVGNIDDVYAAAEKLVK